MGLYITALITHITCACVWIGGNVFFISLIRLLSRKEEFRALRGKIIFAYVMAYRTATYILFTLILLSGLLLIYLHGWLNAQLWTNPVAQMALFKLGLFAFLMAVQSFHDFVIGPKSFKSTQEGVEMQETSRRANRIIGQFVFMLSFIMLVAGVFLSRGISFFS